MATRCSPSHEMLSFLLYTHYTLDPTLTWTGVQIKNGPMKNITYWKPYLLSLRPFRWTCLRLAVVGYLFGIEATSPALGTVRALERTQDMELWPETNMDATNLIMNFHIQF